GVGSVPLNASIAQQLDLPVDKGLIVSNVSRGSGAAAAGIRGAIIRESIWGGAALQQLGDIILAVDGRSVASTEELQRALDDKQPGQTVQVDILRQSRRITVPVRLGERPRDERQ